MADHLESGTLDSTLLLLPSARPVVIALSALIVIVPTAIWGLSFGKVLAGIRVVDPDSGGPPGWRKATLRWCVGAVPSLVPTTRWQAYVAFGVFMVVHAPILWDVKARGLHDRVAGTEVWRGRFVAR